MMRLSMIAVVATLVTSAPAAAQSWPTRPLSMVVPFGAGGATDVMARALAPRLSELLGQQMIIENVTGAGGMSGVARVVKAPPDGYELALGNAGTQAISQTLYKQPLYNSVADLVPVGMVAQSFFALITRRDLPAATLPEFIAYARANHAKMQYASAGVGSTSHMMCVLLNIAMGTDITHVPYRSTTIAMPDMMAGRIDFICDAVETAAPHVQANTVKAIAVLAPSRSAVLPDLATATEQGVANLAASGWYGLFFPKGTPDAIARRLSGAASAALDTPAVRARIEGLGINMIPPEQRTPEFLAAFLPAEIKKWAVPIRASGVSID
ncbi:MAG TPA: tripartite tricarboxylate transporter substrate-binding protein [Xanthobacteraceae bacterium]